MKKISLVLAFCLLFSVISFSVSAEADPIPVKEAPATEDFPFEAGIDYKSGEVLVDTSYVVDISQYEGEGPFDFYGVKITSIEFIYSSATAEEFFENYGFCTYLIILAPDYTVKEALFALEKESSLSGVEANWYTFEPNHSPSPWKKGDIDRDGNIDTFDYLAVKSHYFETTQLTDHPLDRADVNKDGAIDLFDYMEIKAMCFE